MKNKAITYDVIGAGIGGLTTAIALLQKGYRVRVFEQAKEIKPVGAGIILASNAMQVYTKLGLATALKAHGNPISAMNITTPELDVLSEVNLSVFEKKYQTKNIAIHRGKLQQLLLKHLDGVEIYLDHKLQSIIPKAKGYTLQFENGKEVTSEVVLGADGINSVVRNTLFQNTTVRDAKQICWRGITTYTMPKKFQNELNEAWGTKERIGFVQIAPEKVYWYALKTFNKNNEPRLQQIEQYFKDYNPIVQDMIRTTPKIQINTATINDLKPTKIWFKNAVCLIGDAAHATTPNMGQGACQAIEDAYVLSECLAKYELQEAFQKFQKLRMPKAHEVVKTSWMIGKMAHMPNPIFAKIRNYMMRWTPKTIGKNQTAKIFQLAEIS